MAKKGKTRALVFDDLMSVTRVSAPAVAPNGRYAVFVSSKVSAKDNKSRHTLRLIDLTTRKITELTPGPGNHNSPCWAPDSKTIAFVSDRDKDLGRQLWILSLDGGEAKRVTSGYGGVDAPVFAPDGKRVAFSRRIYVSKDFDPLKDKGADENKAPATPKVFGLVNEKSSARVFDGLLFRHWDEWCDRQRNHIFIVDIESGKMTDLTPGDFDAPPISLGSDRDYDFSPKGDAIAFVMNPDAVVARSTNNSIFVLPLKGVKAAGEMKCVSTTEACDCHPRYLRDGRLVYLGMEIPGYEADKNRIKVYDPKTGRTDVYLEKFDRSPMAFEIVYDEDDIGVMFLAPDRGRQSIYRMGFPEGRVDQVSCGTYNNVIRSVPMTDMLLVSRDTTTRPADLYIMGPGWGIKPFLKTGPVPTDAPTDAGASHRRLTHYGDVLNNVEMNEAEEFWYEGAEKAQVHGFIVKPPFFDAKKKYPLILLIHGGPQGFFGDNFHYRWNVQMFAAKGAVVAMLNPRGSTGYGQKFTDQISGDWGGRCYVDIMRGLDFILDRYKFIDPNRVGAAGASFGGFMVNWIAGHTDRFKALVSHDGVFFAETMAYTTEELWFDEHEHDGLPHVNRKGFTKFSPHMFVANFKTPTLVVHGNYDYRCPISEGLGMYTSLQVMDVPSRFLYFPDEGHWVQQPANSQVWYHEVVGWLMKYLDK